MKAFGLCLGLWVLALWPVLAQVSVEITQDQDQFLPSESLPTAVRITNRSGETIHLGSEKDWLTFSVQSRSVEIVPKLADVPVVEPFDLESSRVATKRVDLAPYFLLNRSGRYAVTARVRIKDWNQEVVSPPKNFDIVEGAKLWEQEFGVPNTANPTNNMPEVRKYVLQQANFLKSQLQLYVRVTDGSGARTFRVFAVGPMLSFCHVDTQMDKFSNLHILYQDGAHTFRYVVVNPDAEIILRRIYDYVDKRPRLQPDADGKILITGGVRHFTAHDLPPSLPANPDDAPPKPMPSPGEMMPPTP